MKHFSVIVLFFINTTSVAFATDAKAPLFFYSSGEKSADLSKNVLRHLMDHPLSGPLTLYNVSDEKSFQLLKEIGTTKCGFKEALIGAIPLLYDGKKCHMSDAGVIEFMTKKSGVKDKSSNSMTYEELLTHRFSDTFERKNDVLIVHYDNEKNKEFKDTSLNTESMKKFEIIKYIGAQNIVILQETNYEAIKYILISLKDGRETLLLGSPKWNSDENRFTTLENDGNAYQAGYCAKEVCQLLPQVKGRFSNAYWSNDNELVIDKLVSTTCKFKKSKLICN